MVKEEEGSGLLLLLGLLLGLLLVVVARAGSVQARRWPGVGGWDVIWVGLGWWVGCVGWFVVDLICGGRWNGKLVVSGQ